MDILTANRCMKGKSMLNPFCGKLLDSGINEAHIRSLHLAIRGAYLKTAMDRPSLALFASSSGDPIAMAYDYVSYSHGFARPCEMILPVTSHHIFKKDKVDFYPEFKAIRNNTFAMSADTIATAFRLRGNPKGPIYIIDEVLSGACVQGIRKALKERLKERNIHNEIFILAIASQRKMDFSDDFSYAAHELAENGEAFVHPSVYGNRRISLSPTDVQLTPKGLDMLLSSGVASFRAGRFGELVREGIATVFPVLDLFTTDNDNYNPLLFVDPGKKVLVKNTTSFSEQMKRNLHDLCTKCLQLERMYKDKAFSKNVEDNTSPQRPSANIREQLEN